VTETDRGAGVQVTCPRCGAAGEVSTGRRRSEDFCPGCDYPLFWTPGRITLAGGAPVAESVRRLPGTGGRSGATHRSCPACAEHNRLDAVLCLRCGAPLDPPPPEPTPEPAPVVVLPVGPPPTPPARSVLLVLSVFLLGSCGALLVSAFLAR
jgi:hypothetical protein